MWFHREPEFPHDKGSTHNKIDFRQSKKPYSLEFELELSVRTHEIFYLKNIYTFVHIYRCRGSQAEHRKFPELRQRSKFW